MATLTYQLVQKPIEERIIDAACVYWEVERSYFFQTGGRDESTVVYRKSIVYYLIKQNTLYSLREMANKFGFKGHASVIRSIDLVEAHKKTFKQVSNDLNQIALLADKLDADFLTTEVKLVNNKILKG